MLFRSAKFFAYALDQLFNASPVATLQLTVYRTVPSQAGVAIWSDANANTVRAKLTGPGDFTAYFNTAQTNVDPVFFDVLHTTLASNTSVTDSQNLTLSQNLIKIGHNIVATLVPHPLRLNDGDWNAAGLTQNNPLGVLRDYFFLIYQVNVPVTVNMSELISQLMSTGVVAYAEPLYKNHL